jgi:hypothetical protein
MASFWGTIGGQGVYDPNASSGSGNGPDEARKLLTDWAEKNLLPTGDYTTQQSNIKTLPTPKGKSDPPPPPTPPPSNQNIIDYRVTQERVHDFANGLIDPGSFTYHLNQNKTGDGVEYLTTEQLRKGWQRYGLSKEEAELLQEDIDAGRTGTIYKKVGKEVSVYMQDGDSEAKILALSTQAYGFPDDIDKYGYGQLEIRQKMDPDPNNLNDAEKDIIENYMKKWNAGKKYDPNRKVLNSMQEAIAHWNKTTGRTRGTKPKLP